MRLACLVLFLTVSVFAQSAELAADVASEKAIVSALYDVVSGDTSKPFDAARFRNLFIKSAQFHILNPRTKPAAIRTVPAEDFISMVTTNRAKQAFYELEQDTRFDRVGHLVNVVSKAVIKRSLDGPVEQHSNNMLQLAWDGERWWIVSLCWFNVAAAK